MRLVSLGLLFGLVSCGAPAAEQPSPQVRVEITQEFDVTGPSVPHEGVSRLLGGAPVLIFDVAPAELPNMELLVHYTDPDSGQPAVKHIYPGKLAHFTGTDGKEAPTSVTAQLGLGNDRPFLRRSVVVWPDGSQADFIWG